MPNQRSLEYAVGLERARRMKDPDGLVHEMNARDSGGWECFQVTTTDVEGTTWDVVYYRRPREEGSTNETT